MKAIFINEVFMQDQLTSGQTNLQQQNSNLQQGQNNFQQNAGVDTSPSSSSTLLSEPPQTNNLQVQDQGNPAETAQPATIPDGGISTLIILLIVVPTLVAALVYALFKSSPEEASEPEPAPVPVEPEPIVAKQKPTKKAKKKTKQTRRQRAAKR